MLLRLPGVTCFEALKIPHIRVCGAALHHQSLHHLKPTPCALVQTHLELLEEARLFLRQSACRLQKRSAQRIERRSASDVGQLLSCLNSNMLCVQRLSDAYI